jgi:hypothetical protein
MLFVAMGALTSKPYAFTARPWELAEHAYVDFFDTLHSPIRVSTRSGAPLRVLPDLRYASSNEWISDRARFSYDAFSSPLRLGRFVFRFRRTQRAAAPLSNYLFRFFLSRFLLGGVTLDWSPRERLQFLDYVASREGMLGNRLPPSYPAVGGSLPPLEGPTLFVVGITLRYTHPVYFSLLRRRGSSLAIFDFGDSTSGSGFSFGSGSGALFGVFRFKSRASAFLKAALLITSARFYARFPTLFPFHRTAVFQEGAPAFPRAIRPPLAGLALSCYQPSNELSAFTIPAVHPYQTSTTFYSMDGRTTSATAFCPSTLPDFFVAFRASGDLSPCPFPAPAPVFITRASALYSAYNHYDYFSGWAFLTHSTALTLSLKRNEDYRHSHFCSV